MGFEPEGGGRADALEGRNVGLAEVLDAREARCARQREMLAAHGLPLVSFTMNIPGPVKDNELIRRGFLCGLAELRRALAVTGMEVVRCDEVRGAAGSEALLAARVEPGGLKRLAMEIEDEHPIGRLFDMDVLAPDGSRVDRAALGAPERACLICGGPAKLCSGRRKHPVEELQRRTAGMLAGYFRREDAETVARLACRSLLYEACATPKPGLVDCANSGSHRDMDLFSFMSSASALWPYFFECARIGMNTAAGASGETFRRLRRAGLRAEADMLRATGGVNTHKGAIFSMGLLCGALGRLWRADAWPTACAALAECAAMARGVVERDFADKNPETARTAGEKLYLKHGIAGVRGQAEAGFAPVLDAGLPTLEAALGAGLDMNLAGANALIALMAEAEDTCLIARSDVATQRGLQKRLRERLEQGRFLDAEELRALDMEFIGRNLSPGGSADLLSLTFMLHFLKEARWDCLPA